VPLHENWAFADERKCFTVSIWCPLVESTIENGTLQVVPGSHKRFGEVRGPMVPWELDNIKTEIINNHLVPLETKAGDCVILDDSIVHYSAINKTGDLRLAIQLICIPAEMPSIHYHMNPSVSMEQVEVLEVDADFYMQFNPWKNPGNVKRIKTISFKHRPINEQEFIDRLKAPRFDEVVEKKGLIDKLKEVFA
jgi:ectoine hydroxylase-related dioxygenase (phytanoyl-CoA dioxygenase family)